MIVRPVSRPPVSLADDSERPHLALVQWHGRVGGTETVTAALAACIRELGAVAEVIFVGPAEPLNRRLAAAGIPYRTLGFERGRDVLRHPRRFAQAVALGGRDGALLVECGFVGAALRLGGYRAPIVAVDHGQILFPASSRIRRGFDRLARLFASWADDAEVAVSDFVLSRMRLAPHTTRLVRIHHGVDPNFFSAPRPAASEPDKQDLIVGFAGRLVPGKGVDRLIEGLAKAREQIPAVLLIAGDGPERRRLDSIAHSLGVASSVEFLGLVDDVPSFWRRCDVAVVPSDSWIESFCMVALEAMACEKPVVVTRNGGMPEVVADGETGMVVPPGDPDALADALVAYCRDPALRRRHGSAGRARAVSQFHITDCARTYMALFADLADQRGGRFHRDRSTPPSIPHPLSSRR